MTEPAPPAKDASADEIEADIAATRERLAESVDALADKVNVKARAQEKVDYTKEQASELLGQAKAKGNQALGQAKAKGNQALGQAKAKGNQALGQAKAKGNETLNQAKGAPRPIQLAVLAVPVLALLLVIINKIRRRS